MAHFAKIRTNNEVLSVLYVNDRDTQNSEGIEIESVGQAYLEQHNNWPAAQWIKTSYNTTRNQHKLGGTPFRGNYAGIGYIWDQENQIFFEPIPYASWVKNIETASWQSPIGDKPTLTEEQTSQNTAGTHRWGYNWNEETQAWDLTNSQT